MKWNKHNKLTTRKQKLNKQKRNNTRTQTRKNTNTKKQQLNNNWEQKLIKQYGDRRPHSQMTRVTTDDKILKTNKKNKQHKNKKQHKK